MREITISTLVNEAHNNALDKGWWGEPASPDERDFLGLLMLVTSEVAEAAEAYREHDDMTTISHGPDGKPEGIASELADVLIRIGDMCGRYGIPLERAVVEKLAYNRKRPRRHGGKKACLSSPSPPWPWTCCCMRTSRVLTAMRSAGPVPRSARRAWSTPAAASAARTCAGACSSAAHAAPTPAHTGTMEGSDMSDTLTRLRACPAVRELAEEMALPYYDGTGWGALVDQTLHLLTNPTSPLWPYYRAVLRTLAEGRDTSGMWVDARKNYVSRGEHWSRLERGPVEKFLAEILTVLEVTP